MAHPQTGPILVGLDGTPRSRDALALGRVLSEALDARLVMAHVHPYGEIVNLLGHESVVREMVDSMFTDSEAILPPATAREMKIVVQRSPGGGLHQLAREDGAGAVVVGSSHRSRVGRRIPGSTADRLVRAATVPVALAPRGYAGREPDVQLVGCAFDGRPESQSALRWASSLTRARDHRLVVYTIRDIVRPARAIGHGARRSDHALRQQREREAAEILAEVASDDPVDIVWLEGDARPALAERSRALDLLAVGSRPHRPPRGRRFGGGSTALAPSPNCPLVLVPPTTEALRPAPDVERTEASELHPTRSESAAFGAM